jgi:hypothetical protein
MNSPVENPASGLDDLLFLDSKLLAGFEEELELPDVAELDELVDESEEDELLELSLVEVELLDELEESEELSELESEPARSVVELLVSSTKLVELLTAPLESVLLDLFLVNILYIKNIASPINTINIISLKTARNLLMP